MDHNPDAHLAAFHLTPAIGSVSISTRIKMKRTTWVRAIAGDQHRRGLGRLRPGAGHAERVRLMSRRSAKPASGFPTGSPGATLIMVNAIVTHPMDTGFFRNAEGQPIPAYFIKDVVVTYGDQEVARFEWTSGISRDPVVSFTLRADAKRR